MEVGCVEIVDGKITGKEFHRYVNPERDIPPEAFAIHGISEARVADAPTMEHVIGPLIDFLCTDRLVIHNASFDLGFINAALRRHQRPEIPFSRTLDTMRLAEKRFPGRRRSLDALLQRLQIDASSRRDNHGALVDARLLARVYLALIAPRQRAIDWATDQPKRAYRKGSHEVLPVRLSKAEKDLHREYISGFAGPMLWLTKGREKKSA